MNCCRKSKSVGPSLILGTGSEVPATACHPFLGVLIDRQLRFHEQVARAYAKGSTWTAAIGRMARTRHGLSLPIVRRLYLAAAIPSMLYAVDTFITPL
ncbi:hypothetical protein OH76DRAFT_1357915, partial [Lentinus brumalis]